MDLIISMLISLLLSVAFYLLEKNTAFGKMQYKWRQIIIGAAFGLCACFATKLGVPVDGATINVRDAAPVCAGLLFGAPAGIISGLMGGVHCWLAALGGAGMYSRVAASISVAVAGAFSAMLRKTLFEDKRPTWFYSFAIGISVEVFHMLMLFLTNMSDSRTAFFITQRCAPLMIPLNGVTVLLAALIIALIGKDKLHFPKEQKQISQTFQKWLLVDVVVAFILSSVFIGALQTNVTTDNTQSTLQLSIDDVKSEIYEASDEFLLSATFKIANDVNRAMKSERTNEFLVALAEQYDVSEISLVDKNGIIYASQKPEYVGFDFASGEQSAEFLCLLKDKQTYIQPLMPITYDKDVSMKYAGVAMNGGGFLQVGINEDSFHNYFADKMKTVTSNRHVGEGGSMLVLDSNWRVVGGSTSGAVIDSGSAAELGTIEMDSMSRLSYEGTEYYMMYSACEGYYIVAAISADEALLSRNLSIYITIFMEILIFSALFLNTTFLIKRQVVDNIHKVNGTLAEITGGNLNATVNVRTHSEFASLSDDINHTVSTLKHYIAEAAARIDKELEFAKSVQHSALPSVFPPYPNRTDFDIYAAMFTAKEVGGDFYDFYFVGEDKLAFLVADVSGKGIPAAMFMMTAKTTIKGLAEGGREVNDIFTVANQKLCEANESGMFVTAWMGIIDLKTGIVKFANAGHNPPLIFRKGSHFEYFKSRPGLVLAGMDGVRYRIGEFKLEPGDKIFLYTDGVTEATNASDELFGEPRLEKALARLGDASAADICKGVKAEVDAFVGEAPQFDDITMVALNYIGDTQMKELTLDAVISNIDAVTEFINSELDALDCPMKAQMQIDVAIDEIFSNISNYAYSPEIGKATVRFEVTDDPAAVVITFVDNGMPYDPLKTAEPDIALSAEDREIGGLGIFMVRKTMDNVSYEYVNGQNILKIKKKI